MKFARIRRPLSSQLSRNFAQVVAKGHGVTVEHLLETVRRRQEWRQARFYRKRQRKRTLERNAKAPWAPYLLKATRYAGEGEFEPLMRMAGFSKKTFCEFADVSRQAVEQWQGHPLHPWPILLLRYYVWCQNMAAKFREFNIDPEQYKPVIPPVNSRNKYPRKTGDLTIQSPGEKSPWDKL